jgi:hypothetical protein
MSPILEVLIGMVFLYSLLSILVTQINAFVANALKLRARHLRGAIDEMVQDPVLRARIITHPLIRLSREKMLLPEQKLSDSDAEAIVNGLLNNVTWISPKTFVNVLTGIIRVDSDKELFGALMPIINGMPNGEERRRLRVQVTNILRTGEGVPELRSIIDSLSDSSYRFALNKVMMEIDKEISDMGLESENNIALMAGLRGIKNPYFRTAMETILATSRTLDEAEQKIAEWFNDGMERATESYRRTMQFWSILIGLAISLVLNVDSLYIAQTLWNDPALRATVTATVQNTDISALETAAQEAADQAQADPTDDEDPLAAAEQSVLAAGATLDSILQLRLPLGWSFEDLSQQPEFSPFVNDSRVLWNYNPFNNGGWLILWITKLLGLGLTTIAIAQGAPFWFGILRKLSGNNS